MPWLASIKESENIAISKAILKDKEKKKRMEGFIIAPHEPYPDAMTIIFNCSREEICFIGGFAGFQCKDYKVIKEEVI